MAKIDKSKIIEECKFVTNNAKHVTINHKRIQEFPNNFEIKSTPSWFKTLNINIQDYNMDDLIAIVFIADALNFCFWEKPKWKIEYHDSTYNGSYGILLSLFRAFEENKRTINPNCLQNISDEDLKNILKGNRIIPLFSERLEIAKQLGKIINQKYDGNFKNVLIKSKYDATKLLEFLAIDFPFFNDSYNYKGRNILFLKKAQLLVSDLNTILTKNQKCLNNMKELTAFADYKIPMVLRELKIISYSKELANIIDNNVKIEKNSIYEIEIRSVMVYAIELLTLEYQKLNDKLSTIDVNNTIWLLGKNKEYKKRPHHKTKTIFY